MASGHEKNKETKTVKKMLRLCLMLSVFAIVLCARSPSIHATEAADVIIQSELDDLTAAIPDDVRSTLPDDLFDESKAAEYLLSDKAGEDFFLTQATDALKKSLVPAGGIFAKTFSLVLICAVFNRMKSTVGDGGEMISPVFELCSGVCIALSLYQIQSSVIDAALVFLNRLCAIMNLMIPVMSGIYISGGNVTAAATNSASLAMFITLIQNICVYVLVPVMQVCFSISIVNSVSGSSDFGGLTKAVKNAYTAAVGFVMTVFGFVMAYKNILAESTDNLVFQTARFAVSNMIPIVGGAVGDALRTISGSISVLKNASGIVGIIVIAVLLLPTLISLLLTKLSMSVCSGAAAMIGCERESGIIKEMNSICGFALAITAMSAMMFVFALTLFVRTTCAVSGR